MERKRTLAGVVALVALLAPNAALAQDDATRARQLFEQGVAAMDGGNPAFASRYFQESYSLYPRASTACNMALSLERTGRQCDAESWYRQCAALDQEGRFRDHANRQAAALSAQCQASGGQAHNPFVSGPQGGGAGGGAAAGGQVQVVDQYQQNAQPMYRPSPSHALLGVGIAGLVLGAGGFVGGWAASEQAWAAHRELTMLNPGGVLNEGTREADLYYESRTFSNVAIGLYVVGGVLSALGVTLIIIDLAQPGVFGGSAQAERDIRLTLAPTLAGGVAQLTLTH